MSEVQKILSKLGHQLTEEAENGYTSKLHLSATEQALYDLLMEKVKTYAQERDYTVVIAPSGETKQMRGTELIEAIPVSAINELFGKE